MAGPLQSAVTFNIDRAGHGRIVVSFGACHCRWQVYDIHVSLCYDVDYLIS